MQIQALTFDFADTLFPHRPRELSQILAASIEYVRPLVPPFSVEDFEAKFLEVRDRQFAENRALLRENDFAARWAESIEHVSDGSPADPALVAGCLEAYTEAFVDAMRMPAYLPGLFAELSETYRLCVVSNYPISPPITRTLERHGLAQYLDGIIVSADLRVIKPHPALFVAACAALGGPEPDIILHIGDDWDADILGAGRAGFRTIYTREWRDTPDKHYCTGEIRPIAEISGLRELPELLHSLSKNQ